MTLKINVYENYKFIYNHEFSSLVVSPFPETVLILPIPLAAVIIIPPAPVLNKERLDVHVGNSPWGDCQCLGSDHGPLLQ